jgi:hypothetical protein
MKKILLKKAIQCLNPTGFSSGQALNYHPHHLALLALPEIHPTLLIAALLYNSARVVLCDELLLGLQLLLSILYNNAKWQLISKVDAENTHKSSIPPGARHSRSIESLNPGKTDNPFGRKAGRQDMI